MMKKPTRGSYKDSKAIQQKQKTVAVIKSAQEEIKQDMAAAQKLKPALRQFVIGEQNKDAQRVTKEAKDYEDKLKNLESLAKEVIKRAEKLSDTCFRIKKLWIQNPPSVSMKWLLTANASPAYAIEQKQDMWAFARYLFNEFFHNYMEHKDDKAGYPNPMTETNLLFFWQKFNADLLLLIAADKRRVDAGNKGVILADDKDESKT